MEHEKTVGEHDQGQMPVQAVPTASLEVIEAAFLFGVFVELLDDPAGVGQQDQSLQGGLWWEGAEAISRFLWLLASLLSRWRFLHICCCARQRTLCHQPALWSGLHPAVTGRVPG